MRILGFDTAPPPTPSAWLITTGCWPTMPGRPRTTLAADSPHIDQVLKRGGVALQDIDGLAVGIGPGSWTGAKVRCHRGQDPGLCHWQTICGVTSLEALAHQSRNTSVQLCPLVDAGKENVYAAFYRSREKGLVRRATSTWVTSRAWQRR